MADEIKQTRYLGLLETSAGVFITVLAIYLHFLNIGYSGPLWRDEITRVHFATMPSLAELWRNLESDSFPILLSLVLQVLVKVFGEGLLVFRLYGFAVGVLVIGLLWLTWFSFRSCGCSAPLLSLSLFALSPLVIRTCDALRPHGLGVLTTLLAFLCVWLLVRRPCTWSFVGACAAGVLSVQTIYPNAVFLAGILAGGVVVVSYRRQWKTILLLMLTGIAALCSLLPYLPALKKVSEWSPLLRLPVGFGDIFGVFVRALGYPSAALVWIWLGLSLIAACVLLLRIINGDRGNRGEMHIDASIFCLTATLFSGISFLVFLRLKQVLSQPWYFVSMIALAAFSLDVILSGQTRKVVGGRIVLTVIVAILTIASAGRHIRTRQTNLDVVASILEEQAAHEDLIILNPWYYGISFQKYYEGETEYMTVPPIDDLRIHRYDLIKEKMVSDDPTAPVRDKIAETLKSGHCVWVVGALRSPPRGMLPRYLGPAPESTGGWSWAPYSAAWAEQVGHFIDSHYLKARRVPIEMSVPVNQFENCPVMMISGWRQ